MEQENLQQAEELNNNEPISPDTLNDETQEEVSVQGQPTPIEKAPEKEVPAWDFSSFNTDEIISHMKSLIDDFPVQRLKVLDSLPQVFEAQYQKEYDKALADFTKDGNDRYTLKLTVLNRKTPALPHTGADAPSLWLLIGLPLAVAGLLILVFRYNKKGGRTR